MNIRRIAQTLISMCMVLAVSFSAHRAVAAQQPAPESKEARDARMKWWREARFGMFIHWGVYSVPAGTYKGQQVKGIGEWIMLRAKVPLAEYKQFARQFNPVKYDPDAWAALAQEAGMKYIVITSKHHDGFALFDSKVTDWDAVDATPYGKDLIAPLAEAARRRGLKFGLYYSEAQDWTHPGGAKSGYKDGGGWDEAHKGSFDKYLDQIAVPQVRELLANYKPDVLWWDTPHLMTHERTNKFLPLLVPYPAIITNNRLGGGVKGDTDTPEQRIPATGIPGRDWETCMTMNSTWGYKSYDQNWKSTETLIRNLVDIASKGGNYLLNVGPTSEGLIPQPSVERLRQIGRWMKLNGESIYGTTASPCPRPSWGRITTKADAVGQVANLPNQTTAVGQVANLPHETTLYLHVFDWPASGELAVPISNAAKASYLLADRARQFQTASGDKGLTVKLTGDAPDKICSVVVLQIAGQPQATASAAPQEAAGKEAKIVLSAADAKGRIVLNATDAQIHGQRLKVESKSGKPNLGFWTSAADWAQWQLDLAKPGKYEVLAEVSGKGAAQLTIEVGGQKLSAKITSTGAYDKYEVVSLGQVELSQPGQTTLSLRPAAKGWKPVNVRSIVLQPAKQ
jgi:alpha-L-fucosidase